MKRYSFTISIVTLFATFTFLLSIFLITNFYNRGLNQALNLVSEKNSDAVKSIADNLITSIDRVTLHLKVLSSLSTDNDIFKNKESTIKVMWEQLKSDKNVASIFLSDEFGNFLQARREPELVIREINITGNIGFQIWNKKDKDFNTITTEQKPLNYDPRTRPWYQAVNKNNLINWSDPYIFTTTKQPGITISVAGIDENGQKQKVAATDFTLDTISNLLKEKSKILNGDIILFDNNNNLVGASFDYNKKDLNGEISKINSLSNKPYIQILNNFLTKDISGEIENEGITYLYFVSKLQSSIGKDWYLASFIDKSLITNEINKTLVITISISFLIIFFTYLFAYFLLKRFFIAPINALKKETKDVANYKFEKIKVVETRIKEFYELSTSMFDMSKSIQEYEKEQRNLIDTFIKILAESIDHKSPYTGGHCERVPEIANLLAQKASESTEDVFKDFHLNSELEWREFKVASWLHDCGKIVTPEYVVDKATKLETIYNRIHEIRTRFEILYRDAIIKYHENIKLNPEKEKQYIIILENEHKSLHENFKFLAECNIGVEFMDDNKIDKLKILANIEWTRYFDDRLGLSQAEKMEIKDIPSITPKIEKLLDDKLEHIIKREREINLEEYAKYGFKLDIPKYEYNKGELYNLCIRKGTLTEEERFKINEHIITTIKILEQLPFPDNLKRVPEYACNHHETMIGTGYPRKLTKDNISIPARIMAIADIFEALTASDRPYKKAKKLSESIEIMSSMAKNGHIDSDLFGLFIKEGIYKEYAFKFLQPEQIDGIEFRY